MKNKKQIQFVCLLLLCAMLVGILQPAMADVKAVRLLKQMEYLAQIQGTNLLIAQESKNLKWGVYDTDANIVIPLEHEKITYLAYDCLSVASLPNSEQLFNTTARIKPEEVNSNALMTFDGNLQTEFIYGLFKVYSPQWSAGWVLEEGTAEDHDYTPDKKHFYRIERCDIFYHDPHAAADDGEPSFRLILSLTRDEFQEAAAHGDYLSVLNRNGEVTVYKKDGETVDETFKSIKDSMYAIKNWMLISRETGEMIMDGCSAVSEVQTEDGLLLIATRIDFQGNKLNSLITAKGETIIPMCDGKISSVSRDYAIITGNADGKKGLFSCREKRMILPCEYDDIPVNKNALDPFNCHGYICVKKDDQFFRYEVETGQLLPIAELDAEIKIERYGAAFYATKKAGKTTTTQLIAPDGKVVSKYCSMKKTRGSGYIMVAAFSGGSTVLDWYGNNYLPQNYSNVTITDDDHIIIKTKNSGYDLYKLPE